LAIQVVGAILIGCSGTGGEQLGTLTQEAVGTMSISGIVVDASGNPLPGAVVSMTGDTIATTASGPGGSYVFTGLGRATYTIQPTLSGCTFVPANVTLKNLNASTTVNFGGSGSSCGGAPANSGATSGKLTISGKVTDPSGNVVPGVRLSLSGPVLAFRTTTALGTYSYSVNAGLYTITPTGSCDYTPRFVNLGRITTNSKQQNFVRTGCPVPDGGIGDSGSDANADTGTADGATSDATRESCAPSTTCPSGQNCGTAADGCGGTINCGTCTVPQTCGGGGMPNQCGTPPPTGCDLNTTACLTSRDKPGQPDTVRCSRCAIDNGCLDPLQMGGSCEDTLGLASDCASLIGTGSTPTETRVCLKTLKDMFVSQCAVTMQLTPCLCGTTDPSECLSGTIPPDGALYPIYSCDFRTSSVPAIQGNFTNQSFGAGQANALAQCLGSFACDCF
jgi:hypothetical protein